MGSARPFFSIVTPSLNQGSVLERCIRSVRDQEGSSFEHIVVDAESSDETLDVLRRHPHLRWSSEPDDGQTHAINKGFARARGTYLAWLNCDDAYRPGALRAVETAARASDDRAVVVGGVQLLHRGAPLRVATNTPRSFFRNLQPWIPHTNLYQQGAFFPRTVMDRIGPLDESLHYVMDCELFCRLLGARVPFRRVGALLADYYIEPSTKTGVGWSVTYPEWDAVLLRYAESLPRAKRALFRASFGVLRPALRALYEVAFPPIF
jgi:glycosyltransferase involved in cell wall biosynthesis